MAYDPYTVTVFGTDSPTELAAAVREAGGHYSRFRPITNITHGAGLSVVVLLPDGKTPASLPCHRWEHMLTYTRGNGTLH